MESLMVYFLVFKSLFGELHKQYLCTDNKSSQEFIFRKAH